MNDVISLLSEKLQEVRDAELATQAAQVELQIRKEELEKLYSEFAKSKTCEIIKATELFIGYSDWTSSSYC